MTRTRSHSNQVHIYTLIDPRYQRIRYIGRTAGSLERRRKSHIDEAEKFLYGAVNPLGEGRGSHRIRWIIELIQIGLSPEIHLIGLVPRQEANEIEMNWIKRCRRAGYDLVNTTWFQPWAGFGVLKRQQEQRTQRALARLFTPEDQQQILGIVAEKAANDGRKRG